MPDQIANSPTERSRRKEMNGKGGCACGAVRYEVTAAPLIVHACHCRDCQRITGSAFVVNLWIEGEFVDRSGAAPESFRLHGGSGKAHDVFFCGLCGTTLWSRYHGAPGDSLFVRAGTLDEPRAVAPDVHIFTRTKVPWLELPKDALVFEAFYEPRRVWPPESLARLRASAAKHAAAGLS